MELDLDNLYFEINPKTNTIKSRPKQLNHNWKNISGLLYLSESKIYDLSWAGYEEDGFIKITKENAERLEDFKSDFNALDSLKIIFKQQVSYNRSIKDSGVITVDNKYSIQLTDKCKTSLSMKYLECITVKDLKINWKTLSGFVEFNADEFKILFLKIQKYIQNLFDIEKSIHLKIENSKTFKELLDIDIEINEGGEILL